MGYGGRLHRGGAGSTVRSGGPIGRPPANNTAANNTAAFFASSVIEGIGLADGRGVFEQFGVQVVGVIATVAWSAVASIIIIKVTAAVCGGLRVTGDEETEGLDYTSHGESGYSL